MSSSIIITCSECWHIARPPICDSSRLPLSEKLDSAVCVVDGLGPHCVLLHFLGIGVGMGRLHLLLTATTAGKVRFVTLFELGTLTPPNTGINRKKQGTKKRKRENVTKYRKRKIKEYKDKNKIEYNIR